MSRVLELDFTRGIAVNLMILSHMGVFFFIILKNLPKNKSTNYFLKSLTGLKMFNTLGLFAHTLFLILVGVNMVTSYKNTKNKETDDKAIKYEYTKKNVKRALFIGLIGLVMSILTKVIFGKWYIIFGIFQFIAVAILLAIPLQLYYNHGLVIGLILILLVINSLNIPTQNKLNFTSLLFGRVSSNFKFLDFFPIIPYFIMVLIGLIIGNLDFNIKFSEKNKNNKIIKEIGNIGKWSIQLYFLHIVIIYSIMKIILGRKNIKI
jgi:uncharacterized membrane protein